MTTPLTSIVSNKYDHRQKLPTVEAVNAVLARVTYKDGWTFSCLANGTIEYGSYRMWLSATHTEPDSREPGLVLENFHRVIPISWPADFDPSEESVMAWVRKAIHEWEIHEADEWLRLDGELVHDPHECHQCRIRGCRA